MMKAMFAFIMRSIVSFHVFAATSLLAFFGGDTTIGVALISGVVGGGGSFLLLKGREKQKLLQQNQITRKEYRYIRENMKEASKKIRRLNKSMLGIRSFQAAKKIGQLHRLTTKIYQIVKQEPKRFYQSERFFFTHLDSIVEVSEKYVFLARHNGKNETLEQVEETLDKLVSLAEEDLKMVLAKDIDELAIEMDYTNRSYEQSKQTLPKERS